MRAGPRRTGAVLVMGAEPVARSGSPWSEGAGLPVAIGAPSSVARAGVAPSQARSKKRGPPFVLRHADAMGGHEGEPVAGVGHVAVAGYRERA